MCWRTRTSTSAPAVGYGADPGARKASQARTQEASICRHIDSTEDAAWRCFAAARAVPYPPGGAPSVRRRLPAFKRRRMPIRPDRLRAMNPRAELGLRKLRVLLLEEDPVRVAALQVLDQHHAGDLVLPALGN